MKVGYIHFGNFCDSKLELKMGTPQGSVISPLLCNILLHELDVSLDKYCKDNSNFNSKAKKLTEEYSESLRYKGTVWNEVRELTHKSVSGNRLRAVLRTIRKEDAAASGVRSRQVDPDMKKIQYIRYADDFVFGLISDKKYAYKTLTYTSLISDSLGMKLNIEKTGIRHHEKGVLFLGYHIFHNYDTNIKWTKERNRRIGDPTLRFGIPLEKLFRRFAERGFFQLVKNRKTARFVGRRMDK